MEFVQRMKKREFIEMTLKTIAAILGAFIVIILMEGMIYSVTLNAYMKKSTQSTSQTGSTVAYCIKQEEDKYFVLYYNKDATNQGAKSDWSSNAGKYYTKAECENLTVKKIIWRAPTAFEFTITPVHYGVMVVFVLIVAGFYVYRFVRLGKSYDKIETEYKTNGTIEFPNL